VLGKKKGGRDIKARGGEGGWGGGGGVGGGGGSPVYIGTRKIRRVESAKWEEKSVYTQRGNGFGEGGVIRGIDFPKGKKSKEYCRRKKGYMWDESN